LCKAPGIDCRNGASSNRAFLEALFPVRLSTMEKPSLLTFLKRLFSDSWVAVLRRSSPGSRPFGLVGSGLKLGKLVKDLSLAAMLLAELLGWLSSLRARPARRVVLRLLLVLRIERVDAALC
jgi:hypothetical protein